MVPFSKSQKTFCPRKAVYKKLIPQSRPVILTSSQVLCLETSLFTRNSVGYRARNQQESFRAFEKRTPGKVDATFPFTPSNTSEFGTLNTPEHPV